MSLGTERIRKEKRC